MKQTRAYPKVVISPKAERSVKNGHPWIHGEEILKTEGVPQNGGLVDVMAGSSYMGTGFYNSTSKITVRLISRSANDVFDARFLAPPCGICSPLPQNRYARCRFCLLPTDSQ